MNHSNTDAGKRVELHCHTKLGSTGAVNSAAEIIKAAKGAFVISGTADRQHLRAGAGSLCPAASAAPGHLFVSHCAEIFSANQGGSG